MSVSDQADLIDFTLEAPPEQLFLWSRYKRIQDIILNPIHPLITVIGNTESREEIKKTLLSNAKMQQQQLIQQNQIGAFEDTSRFNFKIDTYDFPQNYKFRDRVITHQT